MVRIINIDTKACTIRVSNEDKDIDWITVKGTHVPIKKGESKGEAVEKFFEDKGRKFYRGSVVHKSGIDRQNIEVAEIRDRLKQLEHKLKKADTDGEKEYIKKVQEKLRKNLVYSKGLIKELSGDFEIDPYDKDMLKEFDDWKKSKQPAKKETPDTSNADYFKSTMQETMKKFPRLYEHEQKHLEEYAVSAFSALRNNPGKEKAIVDEILDSYNQHVKRLGMWVDTPTLAKKAFVEKLAEAYK